jgi:hypothetical protein
MTRMEKCGSSGSHTHSRVAGPEAPRGTAGSTASQCSGSGPAQRLHPRTDTLSTEKAGLGNARLTVDGEEEDTRSGKKLECTCNNPGWGNRGAQVTTTGVAVVEGWGAADPAHTGGGEGLPAATTHANARTLLCNPFGLGKGPCPGVFGGKVLLQHHPPLGFTPGGGRG